MMERMGREGYGQKMPSAEPYYEPEEPQTFPAQEGITCDLTNQLDAMQEHSRILVERMGRLTERLIGSEPQVTGERQVGLNKLAEVPRGSLGEIKERINDLDNRLKEINYLLGRLETI